MAEMKQTQVNRHAIFHQKNWYYRRYDGRRKEFQGITREEFDEASLKHCRRENARSIQRWRQQDSDIREAYFAVKSRAGKENGNYRKVPMYGHTHLYLCSPDYGHADYNKSILLTIKGHEAACEWLIKVAQSM